MPWSEISPMSQRLEFIRLYLQRQHTVPALCTGFGISEKTAYKWIARFYESGSPGLADRSHAPHHPAHGLAPGVAEEILALRAKHPTWGPRKLRRRLQELQSAAVWPAASTIGALLKRHGLVRQRRRGGRRVVPLDLPLADPVAPNDLWTADFKGEFRLQRGPWCYPLTVVDSHSRYLLGCTGLRSTASPAVQRVFRRLFQTYGLPQAIRTDNGVPFASPLALGRLSILAVWWIRLGIRPERIAPGQPQQNGRHERLHRTLKAEATRPSAASWTAQQSRFDAFRTEYNTERPHEALQFETPASCYRASPRPFPGALPELVYSEHLQIRRVRFNGSIKWGGHDIFLTTTLAGEDVAFEEDTSGIWSVQFGPLMLGTLNPETTVFTPGPHWRFDQEVDPAPSPIIPV